MGWSNDAYPGHEGYVVGLVTRDGCQPDSELYRELAYPTDTGIRRAERIQAGCDCGWRSPHWKPRRATWAPYSVLASESDEERARGLWRAHAEAAGP